VSGRCEIAYRDLAKLAVAIEHDLARTTVPSPTEEAAILVTDRPSHRDRPSRSSTTNGTSSRLDGLDLFDALSAEDLRGVENLTLVIEPDRDARVARACGGR
jgi:hypothetical protein